MFDISINSEELLKGLEYIEPAVDNGMVYLESTDLGECILYSESKECAISISLICSNTPSIAHTDYIDYKIFKKIVSTLTDKGTITIQQADNSNDVCIYYPRCGKPVILKTMSLPLFSKNPLVTTNALIDAPTFNSEQLCAALKSCASIADLQQNQTSILDCCEFKVEDNHGIMSVLNTKNVTGCQITVYTTTASPNKNEDFVMNLKPLKKISPLFSSFKDMLIFQDNNGICLCSGEKAKNYRTGDDVLSDVTEVKVVLHKFSANYPSNNFNGMKRSSKLCAVNITDLNNSLDRALALTDGNSKNVIIEADGENITINKVSVHGIIEDKLRATIGTNVPFSGEFDTSTFKSIVNSVVSKGYGGAIYISPSEKSEETFVVGTSTSMDNCSFIVSKVMSAQVVADEDIEEENEEEVEEQSA